jgi:hypothetical protein
MTLLNVLRDMDLTVTVHGFRGVSVPWTISVSLIDDPGGSDTYEAYFQAGDAATIGGSAAKTFFMGTMI